MEPSKTGEAVTVHATPGPAILPRKCKSRKEDETPCKNWAIFGGDLCWVHGGATPQTLAAARERLEALVGPALAVLYQTLHATDTCKTCGRGGDETLMAKTAFGVMDRAGLGPKVKVEVENPDLSGLSLPQLRAYHAEIGELLRQLEEAETEGEES